MVLPGEAGVGKTRLHEEGLTAAGTTGIIRLAGHASADDVQLYLAPIIDSLRGARHAGDPVWGCITQRARWLSAILPELSVIPPAPGWPGHDRHLLFECLLEAVAEAARESAAVWVLDDMHWADSASWSFVRHVSHRIGRLPIVLMVAYRSDEALRETEAAVLSQLAHHPHVVELRVDRLGSRDTEALVRSMAPPDLDPHVLSSVAGRSAGNAAVAVDLAAAGAAGATMVPPYVRERARRRLATLSPGARHLLELLSVLRGEADVELVERIRPVAGDGALTELLDTGTARLEERAVLLCDYPLLADAVYEEIPWSRRRAIHLEVADALGRGGSPGGAEILERARHRERGGAARIAFEELVTAAEEARVQGRAGWAGTLCLAAHELAARHEGLDTEQESLAWTTLESLSLAGRWVDLLPLTRRLWARRARMTPVQAGVLAATLGAALVMTGKVDEGRDLLLSELGRLEAEAAHGPALLGSSAAFVQVGGDPHRVDPGRDLAARSGAPGVRHFTHCLALICSFYDHRDRDRSARAYASEAQLARAEGCTAAEAFALWNRGRMTTAVAEALEAQEIGDDAGSWVGALSRLLVGTLHMLEGRTAQATSAFEQADAQLRGRTRLLEPALDGLQAHLSLQRGDLETARCLLERWQESDFAGARLWGLIAGASGWLAWEDGDLEGAAHHLAKCAEQSAGVGYGPCESGPLLLPLQVDSLIRLDRPREAERAVHAAVERHGAGDRFFAAAVALASFRLRPSLAGAREAQARAPAAQWPFMAALAACWEGELLGDPGAAQAASDRFAAIGARRGVERAQAVLRHLQPSASRAWRARSLDVVSRRELEVAELIAQGLTNQAIAHRLHLSPHTVGTHVKNLLAKLEFSSRVQVAAWMTHRSHDSNGTQQEATL